MSFAELFSLFFYFITFFFPIVLCFLFFKKGKLIWIPPIISLSIELIVTIFFMCQYSNIKDAFTGEEAMFTVVFFPICSAWSIICSLVTVFIRLLLKQNKKKET